MAQQSICFYSNKCDWSKAFIKEVAQTSFKNQFKYVCVDTDASGKKPALPSWLKKVPTLFIQGEQDPIKTDAEVMNWLYMKKMATSGSGGTIKGSAGPISQEPEAWMNQEMGGGLKDSYSFIEGQGGILSHNFELLAGPGTRTSSDIPGGESGPPTAQKTQKEELFDKQMESYMKSRDSGMPLQRPRA